MIGTKITVLVVEDEPLIRMSAVELVTCSGFNVIEAENADQAIQNLEKRPDIALVFTDVHMPGTMDGLKLCHYIRERWPPVKLLIVSGKANIAEHHLPSGAMFFSKPYMNNTIISSMNEMLAA